MNAINPDHFRVKSAISLAALPTKTEKDYPDEEKESLLADIREKLGELQETMYAHNKYSMLICLQGMDTSGKDSLIREVFKEINPRGIVVQSFKTPTSTELEHDYLWRHYLALPEKGKIAIFNRSHYENVLVTRVHPELLLAENLPGINGTDDIQKHFWDNRLESIRNFEKHLSENGMIILKFFLYLGKEEQRERLLRRLEKKEHNWKFSVGDLKERERWNDYMQYYEEAINNSSTDSAPWFVIPADDKKMARCIVGQIILQELEKYSIEKPELDETVAAHIATYKKQLEDEA